MTEMQDCQHVRQALGVYVLGAIDPAERSAVDAHLAGCVDCRGELAGLAGLPALLGRVPAVQAAEIAGFDPQRAMPAGHAGGDTLTPLLARAAHRRRIRRLRGLAAAAAVALIAAGSAAGVVRATQAPSSLLTGHWESAKASWAGLTADFRYQGTAWGTRLDTRVSGIPAGTTCEFWVLGADGKRWQAGSWTVTGAEAYTWYQTASAAPASAVRGFEITSGRTVLLRAGSHLPPRPAGLRAAPPEQARECQAAGARCSPAWSPA